MMKTCKECEKFITAREYYNDNEESSYFGYCDVIKNGTELFTNKDGRCDTIVKALKRLKRKKEENKECI